MVLWFPWFWLIFFGRASCKTGSFFFVGLKEKGCSVGGQFLGVGPGLFRLPSAFKGAFSLFRFSAGAVAVSVEPHSHRVKKILLILPVLFPFLARLVLIDLVYYGFAFMAGQLGWRVFSVLFSDPLGSTGPSLLGPLVLVFDY